MDSDDAPPADVAHAAAVIRKALEAAATQGPSPSKTALLRDLGLELPALTRLVNDLRQQEMKRQYEEEKLSLAALGRQYHMSKARAEQLVKNNRSGKEPRNDRNA